MSAGLFGLLDDVAALARLAAASVDDIGAAAGRASAKAAGVVVDDTAVTPQYVHGIAAERELPIIKRIAIGSLRNKLLFILPAALLLSQFVPWLLTPILMLGATYLCYEGAEKVWGRIRGHDEPRRAAPPRRSARTPRSRWSTGAIRTDFILSAEIMVIALNEVADQPFCAAAHHPGRRRRWSSPSLVYGVVGAHREDGRRRPEPRRSARRRFAQRIGRGLVAAMPKLLSALSTIGTVAMLWVGGHILLVGTDDLGWHAPYGVVHHAEEVVHHAVAGRRRRAGLAGQHRGVRGDRLGRRRRGRRDHARAAVRPPRERPLDSDGGAEQLRRGLREQPDRPVVSGHPRSRATLERHRG